MADPRHLAGIVTVVAALLAVPLVLVWLPIERLLKRAGLGPAACELLMLGFVAVVMLAGLAWFVS